MDPIRIGRDERALFEKVGCSMRDQAIAFHFTCIASVPSSNRYDTGAGKRRVAPKQQAVCELMAAEP